MELRVLSNPTRYTRPLSPFLNYRWQYTMALSFLHRVTGCALSVGLLLLTYWLVAAASGAHSYAQAQTVFERPLTRAALVGFSFCFFYHLLNGARHLVWDAGHGFEKKTARASGWLAFLGGVLLTGFFWFLVCRHVTGGAA
jgi:succinate dehydrogenase / fumarate reductase cytochrome b subunit